METDIELVGRIYRDTYYARRRAPSRALPPRVSLSIGLKISVCTPSLLVNRSVLAVSEIQHAT